METKEFERRQHFIQLATTHAEDFKTRVTQHDRENTFPFENVAAMKASGYTNMMVPEELGGGGVNVLDFALAQERLAYGDGPIAVAINMHLLVVGIVADLWRLGDQQLCPFLERIA
jgi:alkylation response protein AidB-like acyl-CoA dehydrogenase